MKTKILITLLVLGTLFDGKLSNDHLAVFEGNWTGTLTYLNYGDDETLVTLPVDLEASYSDQGLSFDYLFTEPGGGIEKRNGSLKLKKGKVYYSGIWELVDTKITSLNEWTVELKRSGKDNNRKAQFRQTIEVTAEKITVTKNVRYEGTDNFFMRNQYIFEK